MICGITANQGGAISCAYPLTMTQAQAIALNANDVMSVTGQEASYTIQGGLGSVYSVITGSDQSSPQVIDTTTGKKTILFKSVTPSISSIAGAGVSVACAVTGPDRTGGVQAATVISGTTRTGAIYVEGASVFSGSGAPETNYFSMCFDSTTSTVYIYIGAALVYSGAYVPRVDAQVFVQAVEYAGLTAPDIGNTYTLEVITEASDIMSAPAIPSYPSGTTSICGTPL